jgi:hypothetical protein
MPESSPEGTPAGGRGPESWALQVRSVAHRTGYRVLRKVRAHDRATEPRIEMPTMHAELIIIVASDQFGEPIHESSPEELVAGTQQRPPSTPPAD